MYVPDGSGRNIHPFCLTGSQPDFPQDKSPCLPVRRWSLLISDAQQPRFPLLQVGFQSVFVDQGRHHALPGDGETGSVAGDADRTSQITAIEKIGGQGTDEGISGACIGDGRSVGCREGLDAVGST